MSLEYTAQALKGVPSYDSSNYFWSISESEIGNSLGQVVDLSREEPESYYFDYQYLTRLGEYCRIPETQDYFRCSPNFSMGGSHDYYAESDGPDCWDSEQGFWFNCNERACYEFGHEWGCDEVRRNEIGDVGRVIEDYVQDIFEDNSYLVSNITNSTQELAGSIIMNLTDMLNQTVSEGLEQVEEQSSQWLNETAAELSDMIEDASREISRELDLDLDRRNETDSWAMNLLASEEQESSSGAYGLAAVAAAAIAAGLIVARSKCRKNDEDFQRA